jgi:hypothetical protein
MWGSFGQLAIPLHGSCPNVGFFRTAHRTFLSFLSECKALSDSTPYFSFIPVRMQGSFGQHTALFFHSCPNARLFRTAYPTFLPFLSEYGALSDSTPYFSSVPVRMRGFFGQHTLLFFRSCPNARLFRTAHTTFLPFLSKCHPLSDSKPRFSSRTFRIPSLLKPEHLPSPLKNQNQKRLPSFSAALHRIFFLSYSYQS